LTSHENYLAVSIFASCSTYFYLANMSAVMVVIVW